MAVMMLIMICSGWLWCGFLVIACLVYRGQFSDSGNELFARACLFALSLAQSDVEMMTM
jgi:hypothetical protein